MKKSFPPLQALTSASRTDFYHGRDRLLYYAQARYLCYYLEKHGLLGDYYRSFRAQVDTDPTGYNTLRQVLGDDGRDMAQFQRKWEYWLLLRRY